MALYIILSCGRFRFLVEAARVLQVWREGEDPGDDTRALPRISLRHELDLDPLPESAPRVHLMISAADVPAAILETDAVIRLLDAGPADFESLPALLAPVRRLFDAVLARTVDEWQLLRLRPDLVLEGLT
jgi:hypothetical protein